MDIEQEAQRVRENQYKSGVLGKPAMRRRSCGALGVVLVAGLSLSLGASLVGCKGGPMKRWKERQLAKQSEQAAVNTGLNTLAKEPELKLPAAGELMSRDDDEFGSVRDQIEESARQLNVYFDQLETDGAGGDVEVASGEENAEPIDQSVDQPITQADTQAQIQAGPDSGQSDQAADSDSGSGVRVSLVDTTHDAAQDPTVDGVADGGSIEQVDEQVDEVVDEVVDEPADEPTNPEVDEEVDPEVRKEALARELASILATLASTSDDPGSAALALASLEMLLPEGTDSLFDQGVLSEAERTSLDAARSFLRSLLSDGSIASPAQMASELEAIQAKLAAWAGITIKKAALCTRVDGYGWYETFPSYRFVAGRAQAVIVYVELERFMQREITGPDGQARYETKLSQRLELYHAVDDLNIWNRQAETVSGETRNRLRDYYLTNHVTLPANLGVGRYHLKVVMRDLLGERVAETIIPIEIVAR